MKLYGLFQVVYDYNEMETLLTASFDKKKLVQEWKAFNERSIDEWELLDVTGGLVPETEEDNYFKIEEIDLV